MVPPNDRPEVLAYCTPVRNRAGPTVFQVFAGLFCAFLGLVPLGLIAALSWSLCRQDQGSLTLSEAASFAGPCAPLLFGAYVMFRMSRRLFKGNRNNGEPH
jgi:hypothetical protein